MRTLDSNQLLSALAIRDLTDPSRGPHAMQRLVDDIAGALAATGPTPIVRRGLPIVSAADNYDRLYYPPDAVARDARYTRWLGRGVLLRTQTSALIPPALDALAGDPSWSDVVLVCPGIVYRRDAIDRHHVGEPHQVDLWRIRRGGAALGVADLDAMIATVVAAALPGVAWSTAPAVHPYTEAGRQIDAAGVEIGECGLAHPRVVADAGLAGATGLAMGLGLDRLVMLRKHVPDIRLLRAGDPRIASQMLDLAPYRPVSMLPPVTRDLSIAIAADDDAETLGDRVRAALGDDAAVVESVAIASETPYAALPPAAIARIGIAPDQKNVLVRVVMRPLGHTLTDDEANRLRDRIYAALHRGAIAQWAATTPTARRRSDS
jgi:phenylalanyl-tRNA synthetase alpha chain